MLNSNHVYRKFDDVVEKVSEWLEPRVNELSGYSKEVILDRLVQRVAEVAIGPYAQAVNDIGRYPKNIVYCDQVGVDPNNGELRNGPKAFCINQFRFFSRWFYGLLAILFCWVNNEKRPCTLLYGVGEESIFACNNDVEFIEYCKSGPITPLNQGKKFYVQLASSRKSAVSNDFRYCPEPLIQATREAKIGFISRWKILISHIQTLFQFQYAIFNLPSLSLLGGDFAYIGIMRELVRMRIVENIIITTSNYSSQPLWMRNLNSIKLHMVSYSQNWKPISYRADQVDSDVPNLRFMRVDVHWVWTGVFAKYIERLCGDCEVKVVGPILWRMPERYQKTSTTLQIAIFDVPAISDKAMLEYGEISNYFTYENILKFLQDVALICHTLKERINLDVKIVLKTKRAYVKSVYQVEYYDLIERLEKNGDINILPPKSNIYKIILDSDLVISYPFTSINYVADYLQKNSIYYDPTGLIVNHNFSDGQSLIKFANTEDELLSIVIKSLGID
jgi:hypothetical protein